jgi:ribosomal protein S18 acetylase RimI-like enzyme
MVEWRIEPLATSHDRQSFSCGKPSLDEFLRQYASQYERRNLARSYVAIVPPEARVQGYYTLASGAVAFASLPAEEGRRLPRHPVPVAHLGHLAIDTSTRGKRLGETLLLDALRRCLTISEQRTVASAPVVEVPGCWCWGAGRVIIEAP